MGQFTKKPVTIEAFRWTGGPDQIEDPEWACDAIRHGTIEFANAGSAAVTMLVLTSEGTMTAHPGDWIIRGVEGEIYPCKNSVFRSSYAPASCSADASGEPSLSLGEAQDIVATKTAPRITEDSIKGLIAETEYFRVRHLTICIITLTNGFFVIGDSAPAAPENYDQAVGERYAYDNAFRQIWKLEGYRLRAELARVDAGIRQA